MSEAIYDFLNARIDEAEKETKGMRLRGISTLHLFLESMRATLEIHKNWPVLVETEPVLDPPAMLDDVDKATNSYRVSITQRFDFIAGQRYLRLFGGEPPTTPMLRMWATQWKDHPDFQPEWHMTRIDYLKAIGKPV